MTASKRPTKNGQSRLLQRKRPKSNHLPKDFPIEWKVRYRVQSPANRRQENVSSFEFYQNSISFHIVSNLLSQPHNSCLAVLLFSSLATCTQDKHRIFSDFDPNTLHYFCLCCPFTFIMKYTKHFRRNARFSMGVCVCVAHIYDMECVFQR